MSITIRLSRIGKTNSPAYKIVVANTKDKRNGKPVAILGHYNPLDAKDSLKYDKEQYKKWQTNGALVTKAVADIVAGKYVFTKYIPKTKE